MRVAALPPARNSQPDQKHSPAPRCSDRTDPETARAPADPRMATHPWVCVDATPQDKPYSCPLPIFLGRPLREISSAEMALRLHCTYPIYRFEGLVHLQA